jgi:hypothetical protein
MINLYKEPSIISGTGAAIWLKSNFGPAGYHQPCSSQYLTEKNTMNLPAGKGRPTHNADNITTICFSKLL